MTIKVVAGETSRRVALGQFGRNLRGIALTAKAHEREEHLFFELAEM